MPLQPTDGIQPQTCPSSGPAGPPSVYALRAAYGGCAPTRACGRSPSGEALGNPPHLRLLLLVVLVLLLVRLVLLCWVRFVVFWVLSLVRLVELFV